VAMMAGADFAVSQVNLAMGRQGGGSGRQPGSAFKTFALAEAIEQGYSARSLYPAPSSIVLAGADNGADWRVSGGGSSSGYRDLVDALRVSSNTVYAQLMLDLGPDSVVELSQRLGISSEVAPVNALVLGAGEVSVLDMAAAYSTFANEGVRHRPVLIDRIEDADGEVLCWRPHEGRCSSSSEPEGEVVLDPSIARQVNYALRQVVTDGTGGRAAFGRDAAGKTGTTQDNRDAWFVGFTCDLTAAVWVGFAGGPGEAPRFMTDVQGAEVQGGGLPAQLFSRFMARVTEGAPPCELPVERDFPGVVNNRDLGTTTTSTPLPPCPAPGEGGDAAPEPGVECDPTLTPPTTAEPTTTTAPEATTAPPEATTTVAPPPETTTTSAPAEQPTTPPTTAEAGVGGAGAPADDGG
jgi:membrane peptidoglycan carboxypeptidase